MERKFIRYENVQDLFVMSNEGDKSGSRLARFVGTKNGREPFVFYVKKRRRLTIRAPAEVCYKGDEKLMAMQLLFLLIFCEAF